ncbi:MAG: OmpA family protein [Deltaproteobacteria bacterium]|nr:OmpA family protein [Deltaproteobacteria bacterium]
MTAVMAQGNEAQAQPRFGARVELGAGTMISEWQRSSLQFDTVNFHGIGRLFVAPVDWFSIQASVSNWMFLPQTGDLGHLLGVMGGIRFEPMLGSVGRLFIDGNAGVGFTGPLTRFHFDAGLGFEFNVHRNFQIGPNVRYGHVLQPDDEPAPADAMFFGAGVAMTITTGAPEARPAAPTDTDGDGVVDGDDQCVNEPQGDHPDPARAGCPLADTDRDGVFDNTDQCVNEPQGDHPDPARAGCPLADTDHDGVFDNTDQCVNEPQGDHPDPTRAGCPDADADRDGVFNSADQCRDVRAGNNPDPARPGCPLPDRDNDTVPDATDHCPDQAGAPSADPMRNGCPGLVRVENGMINILAPVFFPHNRDVISPRSFPVLTAVVDALRVSTAVRRLSIEGHTDDVGDDTSNMDLSNRRAQRVMQWMVEHGIEAGRLEAHGFGETRPRRPVDGLTGRVRREARSLNRRVDFRITDPAPEAAAAAAAPTGG